MTPKEQQLKEAADAYANFITDNEKDRRTVFHAYKEGIVSDSAREYWQGWTKVEDGLPPALQTVWLTDGKGWVVLGCLAESDGGWHWAESNGLIYQENGQIVAECESDDLDVKLWIALPPLPQTPNKTNP